jgi:hypothetical protein
MACAICDTRRARRFCPGVGGDICSICCGIEREVTVTSPFDCEFLREARRHDKQPEIDMSQLPNQDIRVTEEFLAANENFLLFLGQTLAAAALNTPGAVDFDVREALDSLIRTYRTLQSGVYYESVPANPLAANIYATLQKAAVEYREQERQHSGISKTRDTDILGLLVFLQRLELDRNNGRRRGRAFVDFLNSFYPDSSVPDSGESSSLILP